MRPRIWSPGTPSLAQIDKTTVKMPQTCGKVVHRTHPPPAPTAMPVREGMMSPWEIAQLLTSGQRLRIYPAQLGRVVECTVYEREQPKDWNAFTIETTDDTPGTPAIGTCTPFDATTRP